jgi:hypothetical protein
MPDPQVVFIREDVPDEEYQKTLKDLFGDKKYPVIHSNDSRYTKITGLASKLGVEHPWKVFYYGSNSPAFREFQSSPSFRNYRMAHIEFD